MTTTSTERPPTAPTERGGPFQTAYRGDDLVLVTATRPVSGWPSRGRGRPAAQQIRAVGAYVVRDGDVRWRPAVDLTRLLTTAELVVGAVVVANRLARRPSGPKAMVTMGPGGWVSMKGGQVAVRPARRPWGRPRPVIAPPARSVPIWARMLSAVPLQALQR